MNFDKHASELVEHYLWMETVEPAYAVWSLRHYMSRSDRSIPDLKDRVLAERQRRQREAADAVPRN